MGIVNLHPLLLSHSTADLKVDLSRGQICIYHDVIAVMYFAIEDFDRQRILDQLLDSSLQRPRAKRHVVALCKHQLLCLPWRESSS